MSIILTRQTKNMGKNQECRQQDKVTAKEDVLNTILRKIEDTNQGIMELNEKFDEMQNDMVQVKQIANSNEIKIEESNRKIEQLQQFSKRCNLRVFGIIESNNEKCREVLHNVIKTKLKLTSITPEDIEMAYRCGSKKEGPPRAILVRFYSAKMKNEVYFNKKNLKGSGITIREDLTATRMKIVKEKMSIYGNKGVWTNDGKILWLENGNGKLDDIKNVLNNNKIDILAIGETWIDSRIETTFVNIDGYTFLRSDRGSRGGGVGLYISYSLKFKIIPSSSDIEQLWLSIRTSMRDIICGVVYRPPLQELVNFLDHLELSFAKALGISKHVFCLGDFNVDYANPGTSSYNLLEQFMENFEVAQLITDFTRVSENSSTLIDLILTTSRCLVSDSSVQNCHFSDHDMIFSILSLPKPQPVFKHIRNYKSIDVESFRSDLANKKVNEVIYIRDIDKKIDYLNSAILSVLDVHAPYKLMRFTKKPAPWLTDNLRLIMNLRDTAKKKFIQTQTVESWNEYKKARNFATQAVKNEKKAFFSHLCKNKDSKQIWRQLQNLNITKSGQTVGIPHHLKNVDSVNEYFIKSIPNVNNDNKNLLHHLGNTIYNGLEENGFHFVLATEEDIINIINKLIKTDAIGIDEKTKVIIFSPRKQYEEVSGKIKIKINAVSQAKNLGVTIDSKLRYKTHVSNCIQKAYNNLRQLYPVRHFLSIQLKAQLCNSLVLSHFTHASPVYGTSIDTADHYRIQKVQNSCLKLIFGTPSKRSAG
nr:unnamed protein product [Callosobruchus chinensis]